MSSVSEIKHLLPPDLAAVHDAAVFCVNKLNKAISFLTPIEKPCALELVPREINDVQKRARSTRPTFLLVEPEFTEVRGLKLFKFWGKYHPSAHSTVFDTVERFLDNLVHAADADRWFYDFFPGWVWSDSAPTALETDWFLNNLEALKQNLLRATRDGFFETVPSTVKLEGLLRQEINAVRLARQRVPPGSHIPGHSHSPQTEMEPARSRSDPLPIVDGPSRGVSVAGTSVTPKQGSPKPGTPMVQLCGRDRPPLLDGKSAARKLTPATYDIVDTLFKALKEGRPRLLMPELDDESGHPDARKYLYDLKEDEDDGAAWRAVLLFPGDEGRRGYGIRVSR